MQHAIINHIPVPMMQPLPIKTKSSLDIPKLLSMLEADPRPQLFAANAGVPATVRNWMLRHHYPKRLSAITLAGGFALSLKGDTT
jgi:hypothetical protein